MDGLVSYRCSEELDRYATTELWLKPGRYVATELLLELGRYVATERDGRSEVATTCFELPSDFSILSSVKLFRKRESISKSIHRGNSYFLPRTF